MIVRLDQKKSFYNQSLERALQILSSFSLEKRELTLMDISQALHLPKPTVYRLCSTLTEHHFLKYDSKSRCYALGLKLFTLGGIVFSSFSIRKIASSHLTELQSKSEETVFLGILQGHNLVYIDKREDEREHIRFASNIGTVRPAHFGMLGQVLMAYLETEEIERILAAQPLTAFTKKSITDKHTFKKRLEKIREQGFHLDPGEAVEGVTGVAAPVRDYTEKVIAAVGIAFISSSQNSGRIRNLIQEVCETAKNISEDFGYQNLKNRTRTSKKVGVDQGNIETHTRPSRS